MPESEEPPYGIIWKMLKEGKTIPFLGAGASRAGCPPGYEWNEEEPKFLPSGIELAHVLADEANLPSTDARDRDDLAKVSSYYVDMAGRSFLRGRLRELLNHNYEYSSLHEFLASVPAHLLIVVTNYDTLVEQAFRDKKKPYDLVIHPADRKDIANAVLWWQHGALEPVAVKPNELDIDLDKTTVIYKMHGTIVREKEMWDNFVITEEDYVEFLSRMTTQTAVPLSFYERFHKRSFLFLGYSLRDWNLRVVLRNLSKYLSKHGASREENEEIPSCAIQYKPSKLEQKLWIKRDVNIFDITLDTFVRKMWSVSKMRQQKVS